MAEPVTGPGETTTHFVVADKWGNLVSYTNTIESSHGIGVFAGYTRDDGSFRNHGFLLNNELTDFNTTPSINPYTGGPGFNDVQPGKRPRSSMVPTMISTPDGEPLIAYGSPGGATIINSVFNVTLNLIDHGMSMQQAINAPRLSVTSATGTASARASRRRAGALRAALATKTHPLVGCGRFSAAREARIKAADQRVLPCDGWVFSASSSWCGRSGSCRPRRGRRSA